MVTKTAKPPKVTAALLQEYMDCTEKENEIKAAAKPFADKAKELAKQIVAGLEAAEVTTLKRGSFRATLVTKPGLVSWKDECVKRLAAGELEAIQEALPSRTSLDVQPA
jgi:hypothetical protein